MAMHAGAVQRQQQVVSMSPEHIMGKLVLKMTLQELQQFVEEQFAENPALVMKEDSLCPVCGGPLARETCASCGAGKLSTRRESASEIDDWQYRADRHPDDDNYEPFACVAAPTTLTQYLKEQVAYLAEGEKRRTAEFIIDSLDEDGHFREPMLNVAQRFKISVPQLEVVLELVQSLDPPGIGARDLRECMLIQISRLDTDSPERDLAELVIREQWDNFSRMKLDRVSSALKAGIEEIEEAVKLIREQVNPHPASMFHDPWGEMAPRTLPKIRPDVTVRATERGLEAEMCTPGSGQIGIDSIYADLYSEIVQHRNGFAQDDRAHIRESVAKAKALIEALDFRKSTLRRIMDELLCCQSEFFMEGPSALKPLTKKELAARVGVHESTVCRATQDKTLQLPTGEVIPMDMLFDSALPVKEMVRKLSARRLSDSEIAEKLCEAGIQIARRTVAKYREQLNILPAQYRTA